MNLTPAELYIVRACHCATLFSLCILTPLTPSAALLAARECSVHVIYNLGRGLEELARSLKTSAPPSAV